MGFSIALDFLFLIPASRMENLQYFCGFFQVENILINELFSPCCILLVLFPLREPKIELLTGAKLT